MHSAATLADALRGAQAAGLERADAQGLLLHALGQPPHARAWLLAHDGDPFPAPAQAAFAALCRRRAAGEPFAYLVGRREFFGLPLAVDARVLVPRPETETLVEWALACIPIDAPAAVLDLGTGSGAVALALAHARPRARVTAVDASAAALDVAGANARALALPLRLLQGDWFAALPAGERFDCIVANPPYVAAGDPHLEALRHEPLAALASGADGLDDLRRITAAAPAWLAPGGWLLLEHGWDQAAAVRALLAGAGLGQVQSRRDLAGIERCSGARRAPAR